MATEEQHQQGSVLHAGYLIPGDEISVTGGFTVHFQKKQRRYFILQYLGENSLVLQGFPDEKSCRKATSPSSSTSISTLGRMRKNSKVSTLTIRMMASLKVHKMEMQMAKKKKVQSVLIVVSGSHPKYFRPDNMEELDKWYEVFMNFSSDRRPTKRQPKSKPKKLVEVALESRDSGTSSLMERDSGVSTTSQRLSRESDRSSTSSEEITEYSPHTFLPARLFFDPDDDEHTPASSPTSRTADESQGFRGIKKRQSIFIRNKEGKYEEKSDDDSDSSPRESVESGFFDARLSKTSSSSGMEVSTVDRDSVASIYDTPTSNRVLWEEHHVPVLPRKVTGRKNRSQSLNSPDEPALPPSQTRSGSDLTELLATQLSTTASELQDILEDDGSRHTYINQVTRSTTLPRNISAPTVGGYAQFASSSKPVPPVARRRRADTLPVLEHYDTTSAQTGKKDIDMASRPLPIPDLNRSLDIESLQWEQSKGTHLLVVVDKEDLVDSLALVDVRGHVSIASWRDADDRKFFGKFHVGDELVQVNDQLIEKAEWAYACIKTSSKPQITLHIRRLPFAKILRCKRSSGATPWGFECKANEIVKVRDGPAMASGLTPKADTAYSKKACEWVITEAANQPIKFNCAKDEMKRFLESDSLELHMVIQPKDFIQDLSKALVKLRRSSGYRDQVD